MLTPALSLVGCLSVAAAGGYCMLVSRTAGRPQARPAEEGDGAQHWGVTLTVLGFGGAVISLLWLVSAALGQP